MIDLLRGAIEVWDLFAARFPGASVVLVLWTTSPLIAYAVTQANKLTRRERSMRKLRKYEIRGIAGIVATVWAFRLAVVWFGLDFESAAMHAILVGFATPYLVAAFFRVVESRDQKLADALAIPATPKRRAGDKFDPLDDTGEFRL